MTHRTDVNRHDAHIHAFALNFDGNMDWHVFAVWFALLRYSRGDEVPRVKWLFQEAAAGPVGFNAVQHLAHPPVHLQTWPEDWQQSRLVFIVRDLSRAEIEHSFAAFHSLLTATNVPAAPPDHCIEVEMV
jgi:G3E family GTPase